MRTQKATPGAKRLIESLRNMGYECATAIADLVDNSIMADATEARIDIQPQKGSRPPYISVADNGTGMNEEKLFEAMRFGAFQEYSADALGKYGLGLKTASLSQCRRLTVCSRKQFDSGKADPVIMRWDLDHIAKTDDWELLSLADKDLGDWEKALLFQPLISKHGTVVLLSSLDEALPLLGAEDVKQRNRFHEVLTQDIIQHLRMVFHRFIQGKAKNRKRLNIIVCGSRIEAWDPFCSAEKATSRLQKIKLSVLVRGDSPRKVSAQPVARTVTVQPHVLPREDQFSTPSAWRDAAGPNGWNQQQGFYFYRNDRLLRGGGWSFLRALDEHTKLLRIAVDFPSDLDKAFAVNITKMRAQIPAEIRDQLRLALTQWIRAARDRYDEGHAVRPKSDRKGQIPESGRKSPPPSGITIGPVTLALSNAPTSSLTIVPGLRPGQVKVIVPQRHDCAAVFHSTTDGTSADLRKLCLTLFGMLEALAEERMKPKELPLEGLRRVLRRQVSPEKGSSAVESA